MVKKYKVVDYRRHKGCVYAKMQLSNVWLFHSKKCDYKDTYCFSYNYLIPIEAIPYTKIGELIYG